MSVFENKNRTGNSVSVRWLVSPRPHSDPKVCPPFGSKPRQSSSGQYPVFKKRRKNQQEKKKKKNKKNPLNSGATLPAQAEDARAGGKSEVTVSTSQSWPSRQGWAPGSSDPPSGRLLAGKTGWGGGGARRRRRSWSTEHAVGGSERSPPGGVLKA